MTLRSAKWLLTRALFFAWIFVWVPSILAQLPSEPEAVGESSWTGVSEFTFEPVSWGGTGFARPESPDAAGMAEEARAIKAQGDVLTLINTGQPMASPALAVGARHLATFNYAGLRIRDREGDPVGYFSNTSTFEDIIPPGEGPFSIFSAQVSYSRDHNRFVWLANSVNDENKGFGLLAVSRSPDPLDGWWVYRVDAPAAGYLDKLSVTHDSWGLYLTAEHLTVDDEFAASYLWSFGLGPLSGEAAVAWRSSALTWPDGAAARGLKGAIPHTVSSEDSTFFFNTRGTSGADVLTWRLTGDRESEPSLTRQVTAVSAYHPIGDQIRQKGTNKKISGEDTSAFHVIYGFRRLYAVWTSDPTGTGERSEIISMKLDTNNAQLVSENILSGGDDWYYWSPSLIVNGGDGPDLETAVVYSFSHPELAFPSQAYRVFGRNGEQVTTGVLYASDHPLESEGSAPAFWPDRTGAAYDWFDPGRAWASFSVEDFGPFLHSRIVSLALDDRPQPGGGGVAACVEDAFTACLVGSRFKVRVDWRIPDGSTGMGTRVAIDGSDNSILFWFFDPSNIELLTKVLAACDINENYWVFSAATTNVEYTLEVVDTFTGRTVSYTNPQGRTSPAVTDTVAIPCL